MKCPKCGHTNCHHVSNTITSSKGYGVGQGCCGAILFGPIGLLCGACNMGKTTTDVNEYWICNDCGAKFKAGSISAITEPPVNVKFYFENMTAYPELEKNEMVQRFVKEYKVEITNPSVMSEIMIRDSNNENFMKQKALCDKAILEKNLILFAVPDDIGLIFTTTGIFIGDVFVSLVEISSIIRYKNIIYVNQSGIHLGSKEVAEYLHKLLIQLIPDISNSKTYETYPEALPNLQVYAGGKNDSTANYSSQQEYGDYVAYAYEKKMKKFSEDSPVQYENYMSIENDKKRMESKLIYVGLAIAGVIALMRWFSYGFFSAVIWGIVFAIVSVLGESWLFGSKPWREHEKRLLPSDVYNLKIEKEQKPVERLGNAELVESGNEVFVRLKLNTILPENKVKVISITRKITALGLTEAKDKIDNLPTVLSDSIDLNVAEGYMQELEKLGCNVSIE